MSPQLSLSLSSIYVLLYHLTLPISWQHSLFQTYFHKERKKERKKLPNEWGGEERRVVQKLA
jgi:hypothetical protein